MTVTVGIPFFSIEQPGQKKINNTQSNSHHTLPVTLGAEDMG
jgi:hypothetical protein